MLRSTQARQASSYVGLSLHPEGETHGLVTNQRPAVSRNETNQEPAVSTVKNRRTSGTPFLVMSSLRPPPPPSSPPPKEAYARARALLAKVEKPIMRSWDHVRRSGKAGLIPIPRSMPLSKRKSSSVPADFDFSPQHEETLKTIFHLLSNGSFVA